MSENLRKVGGEGEYRAQQFLLSKGYQIISANYGIGRGEIDVIVRDMAGVRVFVEVKYVRSTKYGTAASKVTPDKIATIRRVAQHYLVTHNQENSPCRIDVVAIDGDHLSHLKNCFTL